MKKTFHIIVIAAFLLAASPVLATSGACSGHQGVNCSLSNAFSSVVCSDGWHDGSTSYSALEECKNVGCDSGSVAAYSAQRGLLGSSFGDAAQSRCADANVQSPPTSVPGTFDFNTAFNSAVEKETLRQIEELCKNSIGIESSYNQTTKRCQCNSGFIVSDSTGFCVKADEACKSSTDTTCNQAAKPLSIDSCDEYYGIMHDLDAMSATPEIRAQVILAATSCPAVYQGYLPQKMYSYETCPAYSVRDSLQGSRCKCDINFYSLAGKCESGWDFCHAQYGSSMTYDTYGKKCTCINMGDIFDTKEGRCMTPKPLAPPAVAIAPVVLPQVSEPSAKSLISAVIPASPVASKVIKKHVTTAFRINVRLSPSAKAKIIGVTIIKKQYELLDQDGDWLKVQFGEKIGWILKKYALIK